jgi:methionyl-tRNA synthetase
VVYVWVDALTNYLSALGYGAREPSALGAYWPAQLHLVGKDILRFHAVYWPAFLMSAGEPLPESIYGHGWWLKDERKMSKSLGNVVRPEPLLRDFGPDALRYFLLREMTFGLDGTYSDEQFIDRYNGDLANDLGNLSSRILTLVESGLGGRIPERPEEPEADELKPAAAVAHAGWRAAFDGYDFSGALIAAWGLIGETNRFLVKHAPWALAADPAQAARHRAVLWGASEALFQAAAMASPVMPRASAEIASRLGTTIPKDLSLFRWGLLLAGARIEKRGPLFPRVDKKTYFKETKTVDDSKPAPEAAPQPAVPAAPQPAVAAAPEPAPLLSIDEFLKTELRVALVLAAERVEGADRLLKLVVDIGTEKRQIVAGIAKAYAPEALVGKRLIVVANLKPAKVRGVESQGMLLAADFGGRAIVAVFEEDVPPGTRVR